MPRVDEKLLGLQVLRGLAALAVLLFHTRGYCRVYYEPGQAWVAWIPVVLAQGVLVFFVISGYLMAWLLDVQKHRHFLLRRLLRIYTPYLLAVALILAAHALFGNGYSRGWVPFLKSLTLLPVERTRGILRVEWTLVYEVFFYAVCALFATARGRRLYPWFLLAWAGAIVLFPNCSLRLHEIFPGIALSTLNLYFISGGLAYYAIRLTPQTVLARASSRVWAGLATVSLAFFVVAYQVLGSGTELAEFLNRAVLAHSIVYAVALAVFVFALVCLKPEPPACLVRLGDYSYGIYLLHPTVLYLMFKALAAGGVRSGLPVVLLVFSCALLAGWQFGRVDVALQSWLKRKHPGWHPAARLAVVSVALVAIGLDLHERGFLALRGPRALPGAAAPTAREFDAGRVRHESGSWGWLDWAEIIQPGDTLVLGGWAVDRTRSRPPDGLVLTTGNRAWPVSFFGHERPDAARAIGLDETLELGWAATIRCRDLPAGRHPLNAYVPTRDGYFVALSSRGRTIEVSPTGDIRLVHENGADPKRAVGPRISRAAS